MSASDLITKLTALDIRLAVKGNKLMVDAPQGALTPELRDLLVMHKPDLLKLLIASHPDRYPFIDASGNLHVPFETNPRYRWWQGGQSVAQTLRELNAPPEVWRLYTDEPFPHDGCVNDVDRT